MHSEHCRVVFFDIDGTLLAPDGKIPNDTREAVEQLQRNGVRAIIATGRSPYHLRPIAEQLGIGSYVSFNGSYVVLDGEVIVDRPFPFESLRQLDAFSAEEGLPLVYVGGEGYAANHADHPEIVETFRVLHIDAPDCNADYWRDHRIYQVMLYCKSPAELAYPQRFEGLRFVRWHPLSVDVIPQGVSKAQGVQAVLAYLGLGADQAAAFGDGLNDQEMLTYVGYGVAMGNAHQELKAAARFVTTSAGDGGIRHALRKFGLI